MHPAGENKENGVHTDGEFKQSQRLPMSRRIEATITPIIEFTRKVMALRPDVISLAQGVVYWPPPPEALDAAAAAVRLPGVHVYGPCEGNPDLVAALKAKLAAKNWLPQHNVIVTHGANQAFVDVVLTLVDERDNVVLFRPAYFDHLMTITQTGGADRLVWGECDPATLHPNLPWLQGVLSGPDPPKMVVVVNPCNPTGVLLSREELQAISDMCAAAGCWLVVDETYEDFTYEGREHWCVSGPHVVHIFSFSKAYGMMGWRVGYIAYPDYDGKNRIGAELLKCQDTICICAAQVSQHLALAALQHGEAYKQSKLESLAGNRALLLDALSPLGRLGDGVAGGEGAIYYWARLPQGCEDDMAAVEWLVRHAGVCLVPGVAFGAPGWVRCSFGNLAPERMPKACTRLKWGLTQLQQQHSFQPPASPLVE